MAETSYILKDPAKAIWLFIALCLVLVFTDLLYIFEKLLILFVFFLLLPAFCVKQDWQNYTTAERRLFKSGFVLTGLVAFVMIVGNGFGGDALADRRFRWSNLTMYYAIEEPHFYEEAYVTFGKIGIHGSESNRVFIQNCCGPDLLDYYNHYMPK